MPSKSTMASRLQNSERDWPHLVPVSVSVFGRCYAFILIFCYSFPLFWLCRVDLWFEFMFGLFHSCRCSSMCVQMELIHSKGRGHESCNN